MSRIIIEQDHFSLKGGFEGLEVRDVTSPVVLEAEQITQQDPDEEVSELTIGEGWSEVSLEAQALVFSVVEGAGAPDGEEFLTLRAETIRITGMEGSEPRAYTVQNAVIFLTGVVTGRAEGSAEPGDVGPDKALPGSTEQGGGADPEEDKTETVPLPDPVPAPEPNPSHTTQIILGIALVVAAIAAALAIWQRRRKAPMNDNMAPEPESVPQAEQPARVESFAATQSMPSVPVNLMIGKLHHIGKRSSQQDSLGLINVPGGILAVIADGMGGLSDGDKVSQKIVYTMLNDGTNRPASALSGNLLQLVSHANAEVNQMLGGTGQYVSGSTVVAVLAEPNRFQWVSVGDSRLYLYRGGGLLQINREHVYEAELLERAVNREMSFQEARSHAKKKSVTSFIGMGELKHVDGSLQPVKTRRGDKLLLTTDGLFNTLSEDEIAAILTAEPDPVKAASALESAVLAKNNPHQDNFSSILICYQ